MTTTDPRETERCAETTRADLGAWASRVPEGQSGKWRVEKHTTTKQEAGISLLRAAIKGHGRHVPEGINTGLLHDGQIIMSDTRDEMRDHVGLFYTAHGHVLLNGLGLGCALAVILTKSNVERVTAIEQSPDVIRLVAPSFTDPRVEIIQADALTWMPPKGVRYGAVWHDIWPTICEDNLKDMKALHRRYGRRCDWQGSWCRARCER